MNNYYVFILWILAMCIFNVLENTSIHPSFPTLHPHFCYKYLKVANLSNTTHPRDIVTLPHQGRAVFLAGMSKKYWGYSVRVYSILRRVSEEIEEMKVMIFS